MPEFIKPNEQAPVEESQPMTVEEYEAIVKANTPSFWEAVSWSFVGVLLSWALCTLAFLILWNYGVVGVASATGGTVGDIDLSTAIGLGLIPFITGRLRGRS